VKFKTTLLSLLLLMLTGCGKSDSTTKIPVSALSTEQIIEVLKDPDSSLFIQAVNEAALRENDSTILAPALAMALRYPRRDSYIAGIALISLGSKAKTAIPNLILALGDESADVRAYAALSLGAIGSDAQCAVPQIVPLLWDENASVRASAANALEMITGNDLVNPVNEFNPVYPNVIPQDTPFESVTGKAIEWWSDIGQDFAWNEVIENCFPPNN
jgi:hypothetical protein